MIDSTQPVLCSVIVPTHESIGRYGGLMLSLVALVMISQMEDRFSDVFRLLSLIREWNDCLSCVI